MAINIFLLALCCIFSVPVTNASFVDIDYLPVAHVRTDPIINQECLSDHVHTFYGPQIVRPDLTFDDLINTPASQTSSTVEENKSLYWHPSVYSVDPDTGIYTLATIGKTTTYYFWEFGDDVKAFPPGFRMIAYDSEPQINCDRSSCTRDNCCSPDTSLFPSDHCGELEISMDFPTCWDGVNLDSPDHMSHVKYPSEDRDHWGPLADQPCPDSHPVRIPRILFYFRIYDYQGGWHTFSDGSSTVHADYISGWDEALLQDMLDNCDSHEVNCEDPSDPDTCEEEMISACTDWLTYKNDYHLLPKDDEGLQPLLDMQPPQMDTSDVTNEAVDSIPVLPRGTCKEGTASTDYEDTTLSMECEISDGGFACFSRYSTAVVEGKGKVPMEKIMVGDNVMTTGGQFETVFSISHFDHTKPTNFLQIRSAIKDENPIEIAPKHMLFVEGHSNPIPASKVRVGDLVRNVDGHYYSVLEITPITRNGFYNPVTVSGTILVDGIAASTYSAVFDTEHVEISGFPIMSQATFMHLAFAPFRTICTGISKGLCKENDLEWYQKLGLILLKVWNTRNAIVQTVLLVLVVLFFVISALASHPAVIVTCMTMLSVSYGFGWASQPENKMKEKDIIHITKEKMVD